MTTLSELLADLRTHDDAPEWLSVTDLENAANDFTNAANAQVAEYKAKADANDAEVLRLRAENYRLMTDGKPSGEPDPKPSADESKLADIEKLASGGFKGFRVR